MKIWKKTRRLCRTKSLEVCPIFAAAKAANIYRLYDCESSEHRISSISIVSVIANERKYVNLKENSQILNALTKYYSYYCESTEHGIFITPPITKALTNEFLEISAISVKALIIEFPLL